MNQRWVVGTVAAVIVVASWLGRYEIVGIGSGEYSPVAYRLDRWTGTVALILPDFIRELEYEKPEPKKPANPFDRFDN